eukprot:jgi/Undpi1/10943/HiC_scaffold_3.g01469.m1
MRTGPAFNRRVAIRVFGAQGLIALSNGFRVKDYLRVEHNAILIKNEASLPILSDLISAIMWLVSVEDTARCVGVAQKISNFCKGGRDDPSRGIVKCKSKRKRRLAVDDDLSIEEEEDDNDESAAHHASAETTSPPRTLHEREESGTAEVHHDSATAQTSATPPPASSVSTSSAASTPNQPEITASPVFLTCSNGWRKDAVVDNDLSNQVSFSFTGTMHDAARNGSVESFDAFADYLSKWSPLSSLGYEPEPRHMAMHLQAAYKIGRKKTYPTETALRRAVREHDEGKEWFKHASTGFTDAEKAGAKAADKVVDHRVGITKNAFWIFVVDLFNNDVAALDPSPQQLAMWLIQRDDHAPHHSWVTPAGDFAMNSDRAQAMLVALVIEAETVYTRPFLYLVLFRQAKGQCLQKFVGHARRDVLRSHVRSSYGLFYSRHSSWRHRCAPRE